VRRYYLIILVLVIITSQSIIVLAEEQNIFKQESYSWFNEKNSASYNVNYKKNDFLKRKEFEGWDIKTYEEDEISYAQNYLEDFQKIYPDKIIKKYIDEIVLLKSINIDGDNYAGTIHDREIYSAIEINQNSEQIWIKMVLAHEFYHVREKYYSQNAEKSPYKEFSELVDSMNLNFYNNNGYTFHDWSNLKTKKYSRKMFENGFIREYSLFSKKEFMANIAQGVDSGAYLILSRISPEIENLMDAYIKGNIEVFREEGYYIDEKFYTEFLPNHIKNSSPTTYNKLRGLYTYDSVTFEEFILKYGYIIAVFIITFLLYNPIKRKYKDILETQEDKDRRIIWEEVLYGTKTLKEG